MYSSVLALLCRSLRVDVRSRGMHLVRLVLLAGIYLSLIQVHALSFMVGAPGLNFFQSILWLNLVFVTLIGIGAFSSAITEEKEEDSLGLLRMAGVDSLGLLLGKAGGRLIQALAFLMVQYPFTQLAITLGGVSNQQIRAAYVALAAYLIMLTGLGMLCSTVAQTSRSSSRLMVLLLILYGFIPGVCAAWISSVARSGQTSVFRPVMELLSTTCIFLQTGEILATGFQSPLWNVQVVSNSVAGIIFFLLSWALFDICSRNPGSEPSARGLVTHKTRGFHWFNPGRPNSNPLGWKDFHFATGGIAGLLIRLACYIGFFVLTAVMSGGSLENNCAVYLGFSLLFLPLDASLLISRSLQDEVRGHTIPTLVMLPRSVPSIVYPKLGGALLGLIPGLACFTAALVGSGLLTTWMATGSPVPWNMLFLSYVIPKMLLLPHLTAVIALAVRWGATPLSLGALYALQFVESMLIGLLFIGFRGGNGEFLMFTMGAIDLCLCAACHCEMIRRFRKLAET